LGRRAERAEDDVRLACYRMARERLRSESYEQVSMRMFRRRDARGGGCAASDVGTEYCCQSDGMIGLGCGARSYTRALHYSNEYAVGAPGVREIIADYLRRDAAAFAAADYGCELDGDEQRRRWVIKSLLRTSGLELNAYRRRFGSEVNDDVPELQALVERGLVERRDGSLVPTETGLEGSDAIGPWLYSDTVRRGMEAFELR
jgi:oxygen-independent coproporphyrinogen-3 oxidase